MRLFGLVKGQKWLLLGGNLGMLVGTLNKVSVPLMGGRVVESALSALKKNRVDFE